MSVSSSCSLSFFLYVSATACPFTLCHFCTGHPLVFMFGNSCSRCYVVCAAAARHSDLLPRATLRRCRAPPCAFVFATLRRYRAPQRATVLFQCPSYKSLFCRHFHIRSGVDVSDVGSTSTRARTRCADHCERTRATHTLPSSKDEIECKETVSHSALVLSYV